MNQAKERNIYRYHLIYKGKVVDASITYDLVRREAEHQREFLGSHIKQIGSPVTRAEGIKWERRETKRLLKHKRGEENQLIRLWHLLVSFFRGEIPQRVTWEEIKEKLEPEGGEVASSPTKNYKEVIEIRVPTRFYWNLDGTFDGIEFGEFNTNLLPWQEDMMMRCLDAVGQKLEAGE